MRLKREEGCWLYNYIMGWIAVTMVFISPLNGGIYLGVYLRPRPLCGVARGDASWLCYNKPTKDPSVWLFPVFTELLFISVPVMYLWFMMCWYDPVVISDNYFLTGLRITYPPFWAAFVLTFVPILAFPILRWRENKEILS